MTDFNDISIHLGLFYAERLQNYVHYLLHRLKEEIHIEIELIIHELMRYSPTIISLALLVLRPKLVLLLTDVPQSCLSASLSASVFFRDTTSFILLRYRKSRGTSHYTTLFSHIYNFLSCCFL